ncbi:prostaglandin D2 receptor 2 [Huso huso]|uniref:Prostaglandin D2 receptor 2 n=1 Tax=Huso huso TaxID=61971 RepID=A0ABR0Y7D7_HUSHU
MPDDANNNQSQLCPILQNMIRSHNVTAKGIDYTSVSILSLASAIGILENGLILWVVGFRMRRTVISVWILNLALSDFLATTTLPFFAHYVASGHTWLLGRSFCKVQSTVFFVNMFVSALLLAAISLDRCLLVLFPVWAQNRRSVAVAYRVSLGAWLLALANALPYTVYRTVIGTEDGRLLCYHDFALYSQVSHLGLADLCRFRQGLSAASKFLVAFLFPLLVIGGSHVAVALQLRKRRGGRGSSGRQSRRFLKLVVAVVVAFFCCWSPYHMMCVVEAVSHDQPRLQGLVQRGLPLATTFSFLNCVLNPFLYVFSCPNFSTRIRQSLRAVLEGALMEDTEIFFRRGTPHSLTSASLSTGVALSTYTFQQCNESKKKTPCVEF